MKSKIRCRSAAVWRGGAGGGGPPPPPAPPAVPPRPPPAPAGHLPRDPRPVRGGGWPEAEPAGLRNQREEVPAEERLAPREEDGRNPERRQVADHLPGLSGRELPRIPLRRRVRVAVQAPQVAGPGDIPDDDGTALGRGPGGRPVAPLAVPEAVAFRSRAAGEL